MCVQLVRLQAIVDNVPPCEAAKKVSAHLEELRKKMDEVSGKCQKRSKRLKTKMKELAANNTSSKNDRNHNGMDTTSHNFGNSFRLLDDLSRIHNLKMQIG